jgi:uncharacterized membrane protein
MKTAHPQRFARLDALRGSAMLWMAAFHFCFDLNQYHFIRQNFYDNPLWTGQRIAIVTLFLLCAGMSQTIALAQGRHSSRFWQRWLQLAACAVLVSIGSWFMFPKSYISFGVLHGMAVMLLIGRFSAPLGRWLWPLGLLAILLPLFIAHPWFDTRLTNWVGLVTEKPHTEDFVPILPWLGLIWWGMALAQWVLRNRPTWLTGTVPVMLIPLAQLGRWPLSFYMLHQPVLIGSVLLVSALG